MNNQSPSCDRQNSSKKVIVAHYHLFKNAGTSVDAILTQNFDSNWKKIEFEKFHGRSNSRLVHDWLLDNRNISAFSSHTAMFPLPNIPGISLIPIVFLRHPIDRLWSVYKFERKHKKILNQSIKLAQEYDFAGYLNHQLDRSQNKSCRNFQTYRFSWLHYDRDSTELNNALQGLNSLPIVGIVEEFDLSMEHYCKAIAQHYPEFKLQLVHKNITSHRNLSLVEKLDEIRSNLDRTTYQRLLDSNRDDLQLYKAAKDKLLQRVDLLK